VQPNLSATSINECRRAQVVKMIKSVNILVSNILVIRKKFGGLRHIQKKILLKQNYNKQAASV
jgi:hypothetical protein